MKIVHVSSYYVEPLAKGYQVYQLVKEQILAGHEVHIVTCDQNLQLKNYTEYVNKMKISSNLAKGIHQSELGATIHRLSNRFQFSGRNWWIDFKKTVIGLNPDILIVHNILEFQSLRLLFFAETLSCSVIYDDHTTVNVVRQGLSGKLAYAIFRLFFSKYLYKVATKIVGISDSCISVINNDFGLNGDKIVMIPLGTNTALFYPDIEKRIRYRKLLCINEEELLVVYTGKIYEDKKVHLIIDALNEINNAKSISITILIVGTIYESYKEFFNHKIDLSINKVILKENQIHEELAQIYNAADISVWPAHTTTSTLDASACGCPIICSDYKTERYKNNNGIGVKDGDLESLKSAFKKLIFNPHLRIEMGQKGKELIDNEFTWLSISNQFLDG